MTSNYKKQTLSNGIRLITVPVPQAKSVTAIVLVGVGSRFENEKVAGISHFLEHMPFKGTKKYPTALKLSSVVDSIGADFNAFTGKEYTGFYVKSASQHLPLALDVLSQLVWEPLLPEKEIEKEKGVIVEEINMREDTPMVKVSEEFESLLYGNTPLGRETIGYKKTVTDLKRRDFLDFKRQWYQPERMVIGVVGGINKIKKSTPDGGQAKHKIQNLIEEYFSRAKYIEKWSLRPAAAGLRDQKMLVVKMLTAKRLNFHQEEPALRVKYKKTEQAHFCLGVRALPRGHKDRYVLALLSTILGGNMSSRLFTEVREKRGLAYYVRSDVGIYFDNGYLVSQAGTDIGKAEEAVKVILREYVKVSRASQVSRASRELKRAKEYLKGKLALALEDSKEIASLFSESQLLEGKVRTPDKIIKGVEKVTVEDLGRLARQLFVSQGLNLAIIGPYKDKERFAKILKI